MESEAEWQVKGYKDLVSVARSDPELAEKVAAFKALVRQGKRPIIERRIVGRHSIEYRVRDRDA